MFNCDVQTIFVNHFPDYFTHRCIARGILSNVSVSSYVVETSIEKRSFFLQSSLPFALTLISLSIQSDHILLPFTTLFFLYSCTLFFY